MKIAVEMDFHGRERSAKCEVPRIWTLQLELSSFFKQTVLEEIAEISPLGVETRILTIS